MSIKRCDHPRPLPETSDPESFLRQVGVECLARGLRLTALRREVLELVASNRSPVKAYELLDGLRERRSKAAPPTVYRALDFLMEHGFVHKIESMNAFVSCDHPCSAQHSGPFLICDVCHTAFELAGDRISDAIDAQADSLGFHPRSQTVEVHGVCAKCHAEG